jgi:membrane protein implicated in regulation of membrane protease activity
VMAIGAVLTVSGAGAGVLLGLAAGLTVAALGAVAVTLSVRSGLAVRQRRIRTGAEGIIGRLGVVRSWNDSSGSVAVDGALWRARRSAGLDETEVAKLDSGDTIVVERVNGLTLSVRAAEEWELPQ